MAAPVGAVQAGQQQPVSPPKFPDPPLTRCRIESSANGWSVLVEEGGECRRWQIIRSLRETIYGEVVLAIQFTRDDMGQVHYARQHSAIKISRTAQMALTPNSKEDPKKEINVMQYIREQGGGHPNVLGLTAALRNEDALYVVMPYCTGGELFDVVAMEGPYSEDDARPLFNQLLEGLNYLQRLGICHRDMSLENILVDSGSVILIIDFGMSLRCTEGQMQLLLTPQGICGKKHYISPEVLNNNPFYGFPVDVWASGIILFMMLTGLPPFELAHPRDQRYKMIAQYGRLAELLDMWQVELSHDALDLLQGCLRQNPSERFSVEQLRSHPWVTAGAPG